MDNTSFILRTEKEARENCYDGIEICPEEIKEKQEREDWVKPYYIPIEYCVQKVEEERIMSLQKEIERRLLVQYMKLEGELLEEESNLLVEGEVKKAIEPIFYQQCEEGTAHVKSVKIVGSKKGKRKETYKTVNSNKSYIERKNREESRRELFYAIAIIIFLGAVTLYGYFRDWAKGGYVIPVNALAREMEVLNNRVNVEDTNENTEETVEKTFIETSNKAEKN